MDIVWEELMPGLPDARRLMHVLISLLAATVLGAVIGVQRERAGKPAGPRTHMLVTLGTAVFVLACSGWREVKKWPVSNSSRERNVFATKRGLPARTMSSPNGRSF